MINKINEVEKYLFSPILIEILLLFVFIISIAFLILNKGIPCAIFFPTPSKIVLHMLEMANLKSNETLYDLGCGSGKILLMAVQNYGVNSIGVEVNPLLVWYARLKIQEKKIENKAKVIRDNLFNVDLSKADVVVLYLSQFANDRLKEKLERELKPGARVISYIFKITGWKTSVEDSEKNIFLYVIPKSH